MKDFSRYEVAEVIANEFDLINSDVQPTDRFAVDYEADEFDMMNLCANLETEFDMKIPPQTEETWRTVQDVYDHMERQLQAICLAALKTLDTNTSASDGTTVTVPKTGTLQHEQDSDLTVFGHEEGQL